MLLNSQSKTPEKVYSGSFEFGDARCKPWGTGPNSDSEFEIDFKKIYKHSCAISMVFDKVMAQ